MPVTTGLILGSGIIMARATDHDALTVAISVATTAYIIFTNRNPLWALAVAGFAGVARSHLIF